MKKQFFLAMFTFVLFSRMNAQNVTVASVNTLPVVMTDTQHVQAVVSTLFTSGDCVLINFNYYLQNDTVYLNVYYEVGLLTVICYSTDTLDLGILPCSTHTLHVQATISVGGSATDDSFHPMSIQCAAVGISVSDDENGIIIFPNPATEEMFISVKNHDLTLVTISMLNLEGKIVFSSDLKKFKEESLIQLNVGILPKGIYFLRIENVKYTSMKRFVKK